MQLIVIGVEWSHLILSQKESLFGVFFFSSRGYPPEFADQLADSVDGTMSLMKPCTVRNTRAHPKLLQGVFKFWICWLFLDYRIKCAKVPPDATKVPISIAKLTLLQEIGWCCQSTSPDPFGCIKPCFLTNTAMLQSIYRISSESLKQSHRAPCRPQ